MKRFQGIWRETWWVWLIFALFGAGMSTWVSLAFLAVYPISVVAFVYFMFMRYDEDGNAKGDAD